VNAEKWKMENEKKSVSRAGDPNLWVIWKFGNLFFVEVRSAGHGRGSLGRKMLIMQV
jgi:hypothetical protein